MEILSTYKYKIKVNATKRKTFDSWIDTCRFVYNLSKETKETAYKAGKFLSKFDLINQLPELKDIEWIKSVPAQTLQNAVERMDISYQNYFRKLKNGEIQTAKTNYIAKRLSKGQPLNENKLRNFGKPRWAKKGEYNSIIFKEVKQTTTGFILPKIGEIKVFKDRMPEGKLKLATVIKEQNNFYITVTFETTSKNIYPTDESQMVGIDMGITHFAVDSNESYVKNQKITDKYEKTLCIKNRSLARKQPNSKRFEKTKTELQNLHKKIAGTRKHHLHNESLKYVKNNSLIVCEDLKVKNMIQNPNLSKHIADASWSQFFGMLKYKSAKYEKEFMQVNPKHTSQKCSNCGHISSENRKSQEKFKCMMCDYEQNADFNASKVILGEGIALKRKREALGCA